MSDILCPHCSQVNEQQREACWACGRSLKPKQAPAAKSGIPGSIPAPPPQQSTLGPFSVTRTTKTTITIDGKQYDRLEDVPEEFRSELKDAIGRAMADKAKRPKPGWFLPSVRFSVDPGREPLNADAPVAVPEGFLCEDDGRERSISWRWFSLRIIGALFFVALWDGVAAFVFLAAVSTKNVPLPALLVLLLFAAVGIGMAYGVIAYLINRTIVRVDAARVSVGHGPLPWFGAKDIPRADISRVWSEKIGRASDEDAMFEPSITYGVKLLLKGGQTLNLVTGLRAPEQALFIEQQTRKSLAAP